MKEEIPLYVSFEENLSVNEKCVICEQTLDNEIEFGQKMSKDKVTAHHFCLLFSAKLVQSEDDDNGLRGFCTKDVEKEISRASKLVSNYIENRFEISENIPNNICL